MDVKTFDKAASKVREALYLFRNDKTLSNTEFSGLNDTKNMSYKYSYATYEDCLTHIHDVVERYDAAVIEAMDIFEEDIITELQQDINFDIYFPQLYKWLWDDADTSIEILDEVIAEGCDMPFIELLQAAQTREYEYCSADVWYYILGLVTK